jgi:hypothetical protein
LEAWAVSVLRAELIGVPVARADILEKGVGFPEKERILDRVDVLLAVADVDGFIPMSSRPLCLTVYESAVTVAKNRLARRNMCTYTYCEGLKI